MRVYHLIKSLGRGGAEMLLPEGLREAGPGTAYGVGYFLPHKDALVPAIRARGAHVHCFGGVSGRQILTRIPQVAREIRAFEADVVHCHLPLAGVAGRLAGRLTNTPVVYTEHNLQPRYHPLTFRANRATWRMQERVVACSEDVARSIHEHIGARVPVQVVQNGVATEHFQRDHEAGRALRERLGVPSDARVMTTVAVFRTQKRLHRWLEVAADVLASDPRAHFFLVGDGPLRDEVHQNVQRLGLSERVHLPGLIEDVRPWLSASDVYVMSSEFEGLPVALLEAMSTGLPAVTTDVGGIGEVLAHGEQGFLVPRDEVRELAPFVLRLFEDDALRSTHGEAARRRVVEGFGMKRMMGELESMYRDVV